MLKCITRQLVNSKSSYYGRYYAYSSIDEKVNLKALTKPQKGFIRHLE